MYTFKKAHSTFTFKATGKPILQITDTEKDIVAAYLSTGEASKYLVMEPFTDFYKEITGDEETTEE